MSIAGGGDKLYIMDMYEIKKKVLLNYPYESCAYWQFHRV